MILYVNGDSHSAGAEAVNSHAFASDDPLYQHLGRQPHPDNLKASWGHWLSENLQMDLICQAESASSNTRILRTTRNYINSNRPDLVVIGWSTWEREEVTIDGQTYQFSAGCDGSDWPAPVTDRYREWVLTADPMDKMHHWHNLIYQLHEELSEKSIPHLFFNTLHDFNHQLIRQVDWQGHYLDPYSGSYSHWLKAKGQETINGGYHFNSQAHKLWADRLTNYLFDSIIL